MTNPVNEQPKKTGTKVAKGNPNKGSKGYQYGAKGASGVNDHSGQNLPNSKLVRGA
jgi:hypothetical protein